jgi:hypothetical protein
MEVLTFCAWSLFTVFIKNVASFYTLVLSFYRSQNVLGWSKIFVPDQKSYLHFVAVTNILCQTKVFEMALNAVKFLGWLNKFGSAQNIFGPVKGQGICFTYFKELICN